MRTRVKSVGYKETTHIVTLHIRLLADGTYVAALGSMRPGGTQREVHYFDQEPQDGTLAPPAFSALKQAADRALDAFWAGELD